MSAVEQAMAATGREPHSNPTGPVNFPALLRIAALVGVPVARWDDRRGRHRIYRDGTEADQ